MKITFASLCCAGLTFMAAAATNEVEPPEFKVYGLQFADGSNTVEIIKTVVGEDGKVFFDPATHKLMVLAASNRQAVVAQMVRQLDVTPSNVRIDVTFRRHGSNRQRGASVTGQGTIVLNNSGPRSSVRIQPHVEDRSGENHSLTVQQLLVSSGRQGSLFIGEDVPYIDWIMDYGWRYHYVEQKVAWQRVGAYLAIEPTVIGEGPLIRVRLTPELSGMVEGQPLRTRFANVATDVTVSDGIPFTLGGLAEQHDFYSRFLVGFDRTGAKENLDIELTAHIVPAAGPGH
jgi:hypothetical protein